MALLRLEDLITVQPPQVNLPTDPWLGFGPSRKPEGCQKCPFSSTGLSFVPDEYPENPLIAVLLEAAGRDEAIEGRPLVGKAGQLWMWELVGKLGYKRANVLISNTLRCRPPDNKYPTGKMRVGAEIACRQYDRISACDGQRRQRGIADWNPNLFLITFHPAAILRTRALMRLVRRDMQKAFEFAAQGYRPCVLMGDKALSLIAPWTWGKGGVKAWRSHFWEGQWPKFVRPSEFETWENVSEGEDNDVPWQND